MTRISSENIGIIILAAGSSNRFGTDKRKAVLHEGTSLLAATLSNIPSSFDKRILVLKKEDEDLAGLFGSQWQICVAKNPEAGMANSLASGIQLAKNWEGCLVGLADMPYISAHTYTAIQEALSENDIVIPLHDNKRGNPVGFRQQFFEEIENLEGDQGAKSLLKKYSGSCFELETQDEGIIRDIDTPDKLT